MTTHEQKYDDHSTDAIRFSKDDFKQQQADVRRGTKQQQPLTIGGTEFILQESIIHDSNQPTTGSLSGGSVAPTPANAALAPIVQASALQNQKSHLDHVDLPYEGEFGSIHMNEGTVPSQAELPSAIGESAAEGFEKLKDMAQPQITKAKEAITHLKDSMTSGSSGSSAGGASTLDQAKAKMSDLTAQAKDIYAEKIQPQIAQAKETVQPQLEELKTKVVEKTNELKQRATAKSAASQQPGLEHRAIKTYHAPGHQQQPETMQHRLVRYRNKAMEIWAGQQPMLRARSQQAMRWIRKNRMEIPLLALGTLLALWAGLSLIGWIAWPGQYSPAREQIVVYNPHQAAVPIHQHDTLVNGPSQNVEGPSTIDKMKMSLGDSMDDIKTKTMDRLHHAMPSMPSLDSVKDAMPSVNDVKDAMPSVNDVKNAMPSMDDVKDAMPSMQSMRQMKYALHMPDMHAAPSLNSMKESIADAIPSVDQVKDAMPSMDAVRAPDMNKMKESVMNAASDLKDSMPASAGGIVNRMKEGVQHIKERINVATGAASKHTTQQQATVPAHEPNTPPHLHTQPQQIPIDVPQMMNAGDDINAPPHLHNDAGVLHQA